MGLLALVIYWALQAYFFALVGRFIVDLVLSMSRTWRPKGLMVVVVESIYTITDPPLKAIRKVIPPLRMGAIQLDFAWTVLVVAVLFGRNLAAALA